MRNDFCRGGFWAGLLLMPVWACLPVYADSPLSGQVSQNVTPPDASSWPGAVTKSLTLTPGSGQFSGDHLHFGRQVVITLYNPNAYAMRFDTSQRLGKDYSWVVPANSQRTVSFKYWNPFSDEVKFLTYQDPASLVISNGNVSQPPESTALIGPPAPQTAAEPVYQQTPNTPAQEMIGPPSAQQAQETPRQHGQSSVRGYW